MFDWRHLNNFAEDVAGRRKRRVPKKDRRRGIFAGVVVSK